VGGWFPAKFQAEISAGLSTAVLLCLLLMPSPTLFAQVGDSFDADAFFSQETEIQPGEAVLGEKVPGGIAVGEAMPVEAFADPKLAPALSPPARTDPSLVFSGEASASLLYMGSGTAWNNGATTSFGTLRLDAIGGNREFVKVEASLITLLGYGGPAAETAGIAASIKKLYLSVYTELADISVGRMIVNYGRGTVFSPVDLFSTVDTADLALGRTGTDAARVLFPLGQVSGLDLVSSLGADMADATFGGRFYSNVSGWDFGVSGFRSGQATNTARGDSLALGLDFKGDLELGISAELVGHIPLDLGGVGGMDGLMAASGFQAMLGCDYSLGNEWFFDLEYLWNHANGNKAEELMTGAFRGGHTGSASVSWTPDEFSALELRCIANVATLDWQLSGGASRAIAQGATLAAFMVWRSGDVEGVAGAAPTAVPDLSSLSAGLRLTVVF